MRLQLFSDLHAAWRAPRPIGIGDGVDVVVVPGDVAEGARNAFVALRRIVPQTIPIVFTMGNHEFYRRFVAVYLIHSSDDRFAKFEAQYIEARLIETAIRLNVPLANRVRPFGRDGLATSPDHEQLVTHALILLSVARFERFEGAQQTQADSPTCTLATGNLHDVQVLDPEAMTIPTDALLLDRQDIRAEGFTVDNRFHLLPGADCSYADKPGLSEENCERRRAIEAMAILEPVPGVPGRARLLAGLDCKSPAMAGKILSGAPIGNKVWQEKPDLHIGAPS